MYFLFLQFPLVNLVALEQTFKKHFKILITYNNYGSHISTDVHSCI